MTISDYIFTQKANDGGTSVVYQARDKDTGEEVAIKIMNFQKIKKCIWENEVDMLKRFQYTRGIVHMYEYGTFLNHEKLEHGYIVMELCQGDIMDLPLQLEEIPQFIQFLVTTLTSLHKKGHCYNDLKQENILRKGNGFRLCDFSSCQPIGTLTGYLFGTPHMMAPELIRNYYDRSPYYYDEKVDAWNLGCVLFEILTNKTPFNNKSSNIKTDKMYRNIIKIQPNYEFIEDKKLRMWVQKCLRKDPTARYKILDIYEYL